MLLQLDYLNLDGKFVLEIPDLDLDLMSSLWAHLFSGFSELRRPDPLLASQRMGWIASGPPPSRELP